jgi:hypothetical protein
MHEWGLAGIALLLIGYAAVSGRLASTPVTQTMVVVALGLLVGNRVLHLVEADTANQVVTWTVALSVYAHGLTAWPGANRYADWYAAHARDHPAMPESAPALPSGR